MGYSLNIWMADTKLPIPGARLFIGGHVFLCFPVGEWGDKAWICRDLDIYIANAHPFHIWIGQQKINLEETPKSVTHAARFAVAHARALTQA